jgi:uroporphyrinogen decarboxylase
MRFWPETLENWKRQGMPRDLYWNGYGDNSTDAYFDLDRYRTYLPVELGLCPEFNEDVLEDRGDTELAQQNDGVQVVRSKRMGSIPHPEHYLLTDRRGWETHYRPRLDPGEASRFSAESVGAQIEQWNGEGRPVPLAVGPTSLFGWIRNWMGLENVAMLMYDDPVLFEEMVTAVADCAFDTLQRFFDEGFRFDVFYYWEDMCYNAGPMISPDHVRRYLLPHYRRISELCSQNGVGVIALDSDGRIEDLVPVWLEGGIHCLYPVEIGTSGNDPLQLRETFGKDLRMMGGFDKRLLARSRADIEREVRRLAPLVEEGGYIPMCDHHVPPDVPLENYLTYRRIGREIWCR